MSTLSESQLRAKLCATTIQNMPNRRERVDSPAASGSGRCVLSERFDLHEGGPGNAEWISSMIVDPSWRDETMKVIISADRMKMSKKIAQNEFSGAYIGITVFGYSIYDRGQINAFFNVARTGTRRERGLRRW